MPSRPNRVEMPGMVWNANHVLHLALKQETNVIPTNLFQDCQGILLLNIVELGVLVSGSYGTGCLFAKDSNGKWSPPCAMNIKSVGIGSLGTAVRDLMVFILDQKSMENLACSAGQSIHMETGMRATLGPLGRYTTTQPKVQSSGIETYAAHAFTKGAFVGVTGDFGSLSPSKDANNRFYKTKRKSEFTPQDILLDGVAVIPKKGPDTLLADVYDKLNMLSYGEKYDHGSSGKQATVSPPVERAPAATRSPKQSNAAPQQQQHRSSFKETTTGTSNPTKQTVEQSITKSLRALKSATNDKKYAADSNRDVSRSTASKAVSIRKQVTSSTTQKGSVNKTTTTQKPCPIDTKKAFAERAVPAQKPDIEYDC